MAQDTGPPKYAEMTLDSAYSLLAASETGLTEEEVQHRIQKFGFNQVSEKPRRAVVDLLSRYWGPMPWLLESTIILSYLIGHYLEAAIIFTLLTINAIIGFRHDRSSQRALELLKKRLAPKAKVLRDGQWAVKDAVQLVPGDVVQLGLGDLIPADVKIIRGELSVDQSALTGESLPVTVSQSGVAHSSSIVKGGEASALVVGTGADTYFGKTAELVKIAKPKSHQQQIMSTIVKYSMYLAIAALASIILEAALTRAVDPLTILRFTLIFLMGAVPVALPAVFAIVLAVGAMQLAKVGALVTKLDSIEDAASMDLVCLDKTGTITQSKLSVIDPIPFNGFSKEDVALLAGLASKKEIGDVIDSAIIEYVEATQAELAGYKQISFTPFDPKTKMSQATVEGDHGQFIVLKGAPQVVLPRCQLLSAGTKNEVNVTLEALWRKGYRTLAVARSNPANLNAFRLVGLLPLADPPRPDSKQTIQGLREMGVTPKMLTGDNTSIAKEIAQEVGIGDKICSRSQLQQLANDERQRILEAYDGLAEIYPEDKYEIVKLLQSGGHLMGMTGDGVNDSPALKQAEVGIAVSNATDVAKASASIVLTEPGIKVILDAITTSRRIYQRMLTWVINKVTKVVQFIGILVVGFFWLNQVVLSVLGMVMLVFANDFATMSLAKDNVESTSSPNIWNVRNITSASLVIGLLLVLQGSIALFLGAVYYGMDLPHLQTWVLLTLVYTSQFRVLSVRERRHFWSSKPCIELMVAAVGTIVAFTLLGIYGIIIPALSLVQVAVALIFAGAFTLAVDFPKYYVFKKVRL